MKKHIKTGILLLLVSLIAGSAYGQRLTKEQLSEKANALLNSQKQREALDLVALYPEFTEEADILYVLSVANTELRDYKTADIYYQKQFDQFRRNADSTRTEGANILANNPETKENNSLAAMMFGVSMISYATADLVNSLRATAFEKNGMPAAKRDPKNLKDYDEMVRAYKETAIQAGLLQIKTNELKDALANLNKAVQLGPKDPAAYRARAQLYRKQKKLALARADEAKAKQFGGK
jgi:tetratricopeptide (TPR) repeat protein